MAIEVPQNEEISGGEKNGGTKGRDIYIIRVGIERRKREGRKFRKGQALPDENDNTAASVHGIRRENARPGVGAIRT